MVINDETYVSFEIAKLLKEKGFDMPCRARYGSADSFCYEKYPIEASGCEMYNCIPAPTIQMVMKWLREIHDLFITIEIKGDPRKDDFIYYQWSVAKFCPVQIERIDNGLHTPEDYWLAPDEEDEEPEYAAEAAIKYCLENLI